MQFRRRPLVLQGIRHHCAHVCVRRNFIRRINSKLQITKLQGPEHDSGLGQVSVYWASHVQCGCSQ